MEIKKQIRQLFNASGGVMTTREIESHGISYYYINRMLEEGVIEVVKRGVYRLSDTDIEEMVEVAKIVPRGIFCMYSSALYHNLSTFVPSDYHIAIPRKDKVRLPDYPPVQLYYWEASQYELGKLKINKGGGIIRLYDAEKTVCDFIKFRNKVGMDTMKEVFKTYLNSRNRNINKLTEYSKELNIRTVLEQHLQILI